MLLLLKTSYLIILCEDYKKRAVVLIESFNFSLKNSFYKFVLKSSRYTVTLRTFAQTGSGTVKFGVFLPGSVLRAAEFLSTLVYTS